jgi:hypothetical protein
MRSEPPTDYHAMIARVIAGLHQNTAEARRVIYQAARTKLFDEMRAAEPPLTGSKLTRELVALEQAIRDVEAEYLALWARKSVSAS